MRKLIRRLIRTMRKNKCHRRMRHSLREALYQ
jgi:hypothetical protein